MDSSDTPGTFRLAQVGCLGFLERMLLLLRRRVLDVHQPKQEADCFFSPTAEGRFFWGETQFFWGKLNQPNQNRMPIFVFRMEIHWASEKVGVLSMKTLDPTGPVILRRARFLDATEFHFQSCAKSGVKGSCGFDLEVLRL